METIACDLIDPESVQSLPQVENVLYLAGRKFGSAGDPDLTWAMNAVVPGSGRAALSQLADCCVLDRQCLSLRLAGTRRLRRDRLPAPRGRVCAVVPGARTDLRVLLQEIRHTPCLIYRLNYAIDLRYGVLVDIARQVYEGKPVDVSVPAVNVLWQGDANSYAMRSLELCDSPARILNVTGPETIPVLRAAEFFAQSLQPRAARERRTGQGWRC